MTTITTDRLLLTPPSLDDATVRRHVLWLNNKDITRYSEQRHIWHTKQTQLEYLQAFASGGTSNVFREIQLNHRPIGTITAKIDKNNSVADVGILIGERDAWNKGVGTEAWTGFCNHLLGNGIRKIEAGAMSCNIGMIRVFLKSGMHQEGRRHNHFLLGDELIDMVFYGRFL